MTLDLRTPRAALATLAVVVALSGCGRSGKQEPARHYVGRLAGGPESARIGLVTQGGKLLGYVCSGDQSFNRRNCRWFTGNLAADGTAEVAHDQGPKLAALVQGDKAEGTLTTADGKSLPFQAAAVPADGNAGVYRITYPTGTTLGWIVDDTGFVGGIERGEKDGDTLGFWKSQPGVTLGPEEQRQIMALAYRQGAPISGKDIQRVTSPSP